MIKWTIYKPPGTPEMSQQTIYNLSCRPGMPTKTITTCSPLCQQNQRRLFENQRSLLASCPAGPHCLRRPFTNCPACQQCPRRPFASCPVRKQYSRPFLDRWFVGSFKTSVQRIFDLYVTLDTGLKFADLGDQVHLSLRGLQQQPAWAQKWSTGRLGCVDNRWNHRNSFVTEVRMEAKTQLWGRWSSLIT